MHTDPNVDIMRGGAGEMYVLSEQVVGRGTSALAWIQDELHQVGDGHPVYVARMLVGKAYAEYASGLLPQVEHTTRQIVRITTEHRLATNGAWGRLFAANVAYEWNDLEAARQLCGDGLAPGDNPNLSCVLTQLRLALGSGAAAT
jgi:hypothetical protein